MNKLSNSTKIVPLFLLLMSCGGGSDSPPEPPIEVNQAPTVDAGMDQTVEIDQQVTLTASANDADGTLDSYLWVQSSGMAVSLSDTNLISATFISPNVDQNENLIFDITVTDNQGSSATDSITIIVLKANQAPSVYAGEEQAYQEGQNVTIESIASDTDGEIASYSWIQLSGVTAELENENTFTLNFTAPLVTQDEVLEFEVLVTDNDGATASDAVSIIVNANVSIITGQLNDTGITLCGDYALDGGSRQHSNAEDCSENFDGDFDPIPPGQDGNLGADFNASDSNGHAGFNFTKLDENGNDLLAGATEWSCVRDKITGMIWEVKSAIDGLQDTTSTYTWFNTDTLNNGGDSGTQNDGRCAQSECDTAGYVVAINERGLCGGNDWQLPTLEQLSSIVDYSVVRPGMSIDENFFPNTEGVYWTSTAEADRTIGAWVISFNGGGSHSGASKNQENSVRLVRKGQ